jgi:hypothetical protein
MDHNSVAQLENVSTHSNCSYSALSIAAFDEQNTHLGWDHFLRGRLSQHWKEAFHQKLLYRNSWANGTLWARGVINAVLQYSLSLWKFRCDLLYGWTKDEADQKLHAELKQQVTVAYRKYAQDHFMVRHDYRHLFAIALDWRLLQDQDCLQ